MTKIQYRIQHVEYYLDFRKLVRTGFKSYRDLCFKSIKYRNRSE